MMTFTVKQKASGRTISTPGDAYRKMKDIAKSDQESFWILGLNRANKEILRQCIVIGCRDQCKVDVSIVLQRLLVAGVSCWIAIHNHPSGDPKPSNEDIELTKALHKASLAVGITLYDHVIVSEGRYWSFAAHSMLERIKNDEKIQREGLREEPKRKYLYETIEKTEKQIGALNQIHDLVKKRREPAIIVKDVRKVLRDLDKSFKMSA